jgi:THUMP domain-like
MTTATCNDLADYQWLTGNEAGRLLAELAADPAPLHTTVAHLRRDLCASRAHLLLEQVEFRRRAAEKFTHANRMYYTRTALEQATDEWTAAYKSQRFTLQRAGSSPTTICADLCCGIGGDLIALGRQSSVVGVDSNPIAGHLASANARAVLDRDIEIHTEDAAAFDLDGIAAWHIDPDRRTAGRRTTSLDYCAPDCAAIDRLLGRSPNAAIKLAPATNIPPEWFSTCEREWISRDRQCRQQIAWHGSLATALGKHRATILDSSARYSGSKTRRGEERPGEGSPRTVVGQPNQRIPITHQPAQYIFDVDPAVLAAHLTGTLAGEHQLQSLAAGPSYLTGPKPISDPALVTFKIVELLPFRTRKLADHLRTRNIGQLEIKKRGIEIDPEALRRDLKLRGDNAATLLLAKIAGRPTAILANRVT